MRRKRVPTTPGLWHIEREGPDMLYVMARSRIICGVQSAVPADRAEDRANADAIAAVPRMLGLLRAMKERSPFVGLTDQVTGETWHTQIAELLAELEP